jgi:hypothetical protein
MNHELTDALDGTRLEYTYAEMGTVVVQFDSGRLGFEWTQGPLKGVSGQNFDYRPRQVGDDLFFVNWHEPEARGFVTLYLDLKSNFACSSVLAAYATDDEQTLFHSASVNRVESL